MAELTIRRSAAMELSETDTFGVFLREQEDGDGDGIDFMVSLRRPSEQDRRLGQDTYCVSLPNGATVYGAVRSWRLEGAVLHVQFRQDAASNLGIDERAAFTLEVAPEEIEAVRSSLARVLGPELA